MSEEGTGKHGHKDSKEPWSHHQESDRNQQASGEQREAGSEKHSSDRSHTDESLKERQYRDEQGNVHHHTKTYMQQHSNEE